MVCQPLRLALLIGAVTAVAVSPARANFRAPACCDPCGSSATTAPAYRTITCTEWVRESYQSKRTSYKFECRTETYDACRTECVPETRERTVCVVKRVPIVKEECRKVCHKVTVYEDRVVNKTAYKHVQETVMKKQLVRLGHWECKEVTPLFSGFGGLFSGHGHCGSACDTGCSTGCTTACSEPCHTTRTKKVWVHCPEYKECPVTVCKKVCYTEAVTCKVPVTRTEWREEKVKVCSYQCVNETRVEKYTVYTKHTVPYKATRTVRVCVPYEETVTCTKLVPRTVTRQVQDTTCSTGCSTTSSSCEHRSFFSGFSGLFNRCHSDCQRSSCCN